MKRNCILFCSHLLDTVCRLLGGGGKIGAASISFLLFSFEMFAARLAQEELDLILEMKTL